MPRGEQGTELSVMRHRMVMPVLVQTPKNEPKHTLGPAPFPSPPAVQLSSRWDWLEPPAAFHRSSAGRAASLGTGPWWQQWEDGPSPGGSSGDAQPGRGGSRVNQQPLPGVGDTGHCQGTDSHCCCICHPLVPGAQELSVLTCSSVLKVGSGSFLGLG